MDPDPCIMQARDHGQHDGRVERYHAQNHHPGRLGELVQQHRSHGGNLGKGVGLAEDAGVKFAPAHAAYRMAETSRMPTSRPKTSTVTALASGPGASAPGTACSAAACRPPGRGIGPARCAASATGPACHPAHRSVRRPERESKPSSNRFSRMAATRNGARQMRNNVSRLGAVRSGLMRGFDTSVMAGSTGNGLQRQPKAGPVQRPDAGERGFVAGARNGNF